MSDRQRAESMTTINFTVPVPPSLKNGMRLGRRWGSRRVSLRRSGAVNRALREIQQAALNAIDGAPKPDGASLFGDDDIAVAIHHNVLLDRLEIEVTSWGPRPKGKTGRKRDLQNLQDTVLDALQGILYDNDNQIVILNMRRSR